MRPVFAYRVFVIGSWYLVCLLLFVVGAIPAVCQGQSAPSESTPLAFEELATASESPREIRREIVDPMRVAALGPEPALPDFTQTHNVQTPYDSFSPHETRAAVMPILGPVLPAEHLLSGGYDGLIDGYAQQLLHGGHPSCIEISSAGLSVACGDCVSACERRTGWYATVQTLFLNPLERSQKPVSRDVTGATVLDTSDFDIDWSVGIEGRIGLRTSDSVLEFGGWTLLSTSDSIERISPTSDLVSAINFNGIGIPFGPAELHRIENEIEIQSMDVRHVIAKSRPAPWQCGIWWGLRFFRVRDVFRFDSDLSRTASLDDIRYEVEVDNRLIGPHLGGMANWQVAPRLALQFETQVGVYYNDIDESQAARNDIGIATFNTGPNAGRPFEFDVDDTVAAILAELDLELEYQVTERIHVLLGYRVLAAAGVARAASQIPSQLGAIDEVTIDASDALLLHGFQFGIDFSF